MKFNNFAITIDPIKLHNLINFLDNSNLVIKKLSVVMLSYKYSQAEQEEFSYCDYIEFVDSAKYKWQGTDIYLYDDNLANLNYFTRVCAEGIFGIDLTGHTAVLDEMPVVIPQVDELEIDKSFNKGMVALPDMQVISQIMLLKPFLTVVGEQEDLILSLTNLLPYSFIDSVQGIEQLIQDSRAVLNHHESVSKPYAFNLLDASSIDPSRNINIASQLKKLLPSLRVVHNNQIVVPVFNGITQLVNISRDSFNNWEEHDIEQWKLRLGVVKYLEVTPTVLASPRQFLSQQDVEESYVNLSSIANNQGSLDFKVIIDNQFLFARLIVDLLELLEISYLQRLRDQ